MRPRTGTHTETHRHTDARDHNTFASSTTRLTQMWQRLPVCWPFWLQGLRVGTVRRIADAFFMLQINFVKINLRHAISVLVLDMRTGTFLFPKHCTWSIFVYLVLCLHVSVLYCSIVFFDCSLPIRIKVLFDLMWFTYQTSEFCTVLCKLQLKSNLRAFDVDNGDFKCLFNLVRIFPFGYNSKFNLQIRTITAKPSICWSWPIIWKKNSMKLFTCTKRIFFRPYSKFWHSATV